MMIILVSYIILAVLSLGSDVSDLGEKEIGYDVGQYPPQFEFRKILGERSVESLSWEKLRGKVVIVDFWATWCLPCIETIPHINGLVEKFKDEPVIFISVTYEPDNLVLPFLKEHPIKAIKALDENFSTFETFRAWAIPLVLLVNKEGMISGRIHPNYLTEDVINEVLNSTIPDVVQSPDEQFDPEKAEEYFRSLME